MADKSAVKKFIAWLAKGSKKTEAEKAAYKQRMREKKKGFAQLTREALGAAGAKALPAGTREQQQTQKAKKLKGARLKTFKQGKQKLQIKKRINLEAVLRQRIAAKKKKGKLVSPADIAKMREQIKKSMQM